MPKGNRVHPAISGECDKCGEYSKDVREIMICGECSTKLVRRLDNFDWLVEEIRDAVMDARQRGVRYVEEKRDYEAGNKVLDQYLNEISLAVLEASRIQFELEEIGDEISRICGLGRRD